MENQNDVSVTPPVETLPVSATIESPLRKNQGLFVFVILAVFLMIFISLYAYVLWDAQQISKPRPAHEYVAAGEDRFLEGKEPDRGVYKLIKADATVVPMAVENMVQYGSFYKDTSTDFVYRLAKTNSCGEISEYHLELLTTVNTKTFRVFRDNNRYATDGERVYFNEGYVACDGVFELVSVPDADSKTFEPIKPTNELVYPADMFYAKDARHVFRFGEIVEDADPATFVFSKEVSQYSLDKDTVFFNGEKLFGADPASFEVLDATYGDVGYVLSRDEKFVFVGGCRFEHLDPRTVTLEGFRTMEGDADQKFVVRDKKGTYVLSNYNDYTKQVDCWIKVISVISPTLSTYEYENIPTTCELDFCETRLLRIAAEGDIDILSENIQEEYRQFSGNGENYYLELFGVQATSEGDQILFLGYRRWSESVMQYIAYNVASRKFTPLQNALFDVLASRVVSSDKTRIVVLKHDGSALELIDLRNDTRTSIVRLTNPNESLMGSIHGFDGATAIGNYVWLDNQTLEYSVYRFVPLEQMTGDVERPLIEKRTITIPSS